MAMTRIMTSADDIATAIPDGSLIALPPEYAPCSMAVIRALVRRGARDLRLLAVPQFGFQADLLIGAGAVAEIEAAGVTFGEHGLAPRFTAAVKQGEIRMRDTTCPAVHASLQAAEKGLPFMALRGLIGTDLLARRDDWIVADNPFAEDDPIVHLKAIQPDMTLFHAPKADRHGNVWIGVRRELMLMAHASKAAYVTVEELVDGSLLDDPLLAAGTIPNMYVTGVAEVAQGAWPLGVPGMYDLDHEHLAEYTAMARSTDGFQAYLDQWVVQRAAAE